MMDGDQDLTLVVEPWRVKLLVGIVFVYAVWKLAMEAGRIHSDLRSINAALRAEFDATETPPREKQRRHLGQYPTPESDRERHGDAEGDDA